MRRKLRGVIVGIAALAVVAGLPASQAHAAGSIDAFTIDGNAGSFMLNQGSVNLDDSNATFGVNSSGTNGLWFFTTSTDNVHNWHFQLSPPTGQGLTTGTYRTLQSADATHAGLMVFGDGRGCEQTGTVTVTEIANDPDTQDVTSFAASYHAACTPSILTTYTAVSGEVRWHSTVDYVAGAESPVSFDFGTVNGGATSTAQTITVTSAGSTALQLGTATLGGTTPGAFQVSNDGCAGQSLSNGQTCTVSVVAHPMDAGQLNATLLIPDNSAAGFRRVPLTVNGFYPNRSASVNPSSLQFAASIVGTNSPGQQVIVTSTGSVPVTFGTVSFSGANQDAFVIKTDNCSGVSLSPTHQCVVVLAGHPTAVGHQTASLVIPDDSAAHSHSVALSVDGISGVIGNYYPLQPARILDTRTGNGAPKAPLGPGGVLSLQVTGRGGVAGAAVSAVVLNVTVTSPTAASYLAVYPSGTPRPTVSNLNFPKGWTGANNVTVPVGPDGKVSIYNLTGSTQVIADVLGFYAADNSILAQDGPGGQYQPVTPERLLDSRDPSIGEPLHSGFYFEIPVDYGADFNPHIRALAVNVTATGSKGSGFLTTWNADPAQLPTASTLNFTPKATVPNLAIVPTRACDIVPSCSDLPAIGVYNGSSGDVDVIVDIVGVYDDGLLGDGLTFHPITPTRIVDTRTGLGAPAAIGPKGTATITTPGTVADPNTVALAANVTAVAPTASTYLSVWPADAGLSQPTVSTVNAKAGQVVPNAALITIGPAAGFNIFNNAGNTNVLVDVAGVFTFNSLVPAAASLSAAQKSGAGLTVIPHPVFVRAQPIGP